MENKIIQCIQCDTEFEFTPFNQEEYAAKGYDEPKRCPTCRKHKIKTSFDGHEGRKSFNGHEGRKKGKKRHYYDKYGDEY